MPTPDMEVLCLGTTTARKVASVLADTIYSYFWANKKVPQQTQAAKIPVGTCQELRLKICACLIQKQLFWISSWRIPTSCLFCELHSHLGLWHPAPALPVPAQPSSCSCISILLTLLTDRAEPHQLLTALMSCLQFIFYYFFHFCCSEHSLLLGNHQAADQLHLSDPSKTRDTRNQRWMILEAKPAICSQNQGKSEILRTSEYFNQLQMPHKYYFPLLKKIPKQNQTKHTQKSQANK